MTVRVLRHPYEEGTRVRHAKDDAYSARITGTAEIVEAHPQPDGSYDYTVRRDGGESQSWPSYFTIPVQSAHDSRRNGTATDSRSGAPADARGEAPSPGNRERRQTPS